ncbi:MAG: ABC transporter permease [Ignavibacteria bacterium]
MNTVSSVPHFIIQPQKKWKLIDFKELYKHKDLLYFFVLRDVTVLYKQTVFGLIWAIMNPVFSMVVFSFIFGNLANIPSDGIPYPIFSFSAVLPWTYFSQAMNGATNSLLSSTSIFTKVYFPRIIIPLTPIVSKLADFFIAFVILIIMMLFYNIVPNINIIFLPFLILLMVLSAAGIGMWLSSLAIQYRDVRFAVGLLTTLLMYAAPVVFPASLVQQKFGDVLYYLYGIYPMVGVIEGFRASLLGFREMPWGLILIGTVSSTILFISGTYHFRKTEKIFADVA